VIDPPPSVLGLHRERQHSRAGEQLEDLRGGPLVLQPTRERTDAEQHVVGRELGEVARHDLGVAPQAPWLSSAPLGVPMVPEV
jgi:hypothetical protein